MAESNRYIGITIGPIYDTMTLTSTPAGLWGASYLFSCIAKELCDRLGKVMKLITPYYNPDDSLFQNHLGVGLMPDHLIFEQGEASLEDVQAIIDEVKVYAADQLVASGTHADPSVKDFYRHYLQIHAIAFTSDYNVILDSAQALDAIELERSFPVIERENPILACLELPRSQRGSISRNDAMKNSRMVRETIRDGSWQLLKKDGKIRDLEDIACGGWRLEERPEKERFKKHAYYAIVQSDGDRMRKVIEACTNDNEIRDFSRNCLVYTATAAEMVQNYGGVTIYAGGDDLLFIAPVENKEKENIFTLLDTIRVQFEKLFLNRATVSFGVAVCYYKFPLYEAFKLAHNMLFAQAKRVLGKNALALTLQKNSGRSVELGFSHFSDNKCLDQIVSLLQALLSAEAEVTLLSSAISHLHQYDVLFAHALHVWQTGGDDHVLENIFTNTFDADLHSETDTAAYLKRVKELLENAHLCHVKAEMPEDINIEIREALPRLRAMDGMLRLIQFFLEKGREER